MLTTCTASQLSGKTTRRCAGHAGVVCARHRTASQRAEFVQRPALFSSPLPSRAARRASGVRPFGARKRDDAGTAEPEDKSGTTPGGDMLLEDAHTRVTWFCC